MFKAVIFDMDGTLIDSEIVWDVAEKEMFADRGLKYTMKEREQVIGLRMDAFFEKLIAIYGLDEPVEALSQELVERMLEKIPLMVKSKPGAQAILEWAVEQNLPFCIASSSPMSIIEANIRAQGWSDLISHLFTADSVPHGKPAPDIYLYAAEQLGVNPPDCLALEDSPAGAKSAVAAGMTCYVVPDVHSSPAKFSAITPYVFDSLHDVLAKLKA